MKMLTHENSLRLMFTLLLMCLFTVNISQAQEASPAKAQNIVLITVDDLNAWVGALKQHPLAYTPNIDKIASMGVSFTNAYTPAPVCAAARAAMMSGVAPYKSGFYTNGNHQGNAHNIIDYVPHLTEVFASAGYTTLGAGKIYHRWVTDGDNALDAKMFDNYLPLAEIMPTEDMLSDGDGYKGYKFYPFPAGGTRLKRELNISKGVSLSAGPVSRSKMRDGKMPDEVIAQWAVSQIANQATQKSQQKPFFMTLGFLRPHVPFAVPKSYFDLFPLKDIKLPTTDTMQDIPLYGKAMTMGLVPNGDHGAVLKLGDTFWKELIQGYLASIAFVDDQIGKVVNALEHHNLMTNTLIVITSDHGQNFGEKANWRKMSLWEESTRVPLIFASNQLPHRGEHVTAAVNLLDIYPTLVAQAGLQKQPHTDGNDLSPLLTNPHSYWDKPTLTSWRYKNFAVRSNRYRYIRYRDGSEELYDHQTDPLELENLALEPKAHAVIKELQQYIPSKVALPHDKNKWQGDILEEIIISWEKNGQPKWFN